VGGDTTAMIWWSKTQMRWAETQKLEHTSPDGSMSPQTDIKKMTADELKNELNKRGINPVLVGL